MLLIAGFGDDSSMYSGLLGTALAEAFELLPLDLPGFGAPALGGETTLGSLAEFVARKAREAGAEILVAHSVASIIASLAAREAECPITTILSLEGNLVADDAYFSGSAADYEDAQSFRSAFLTRLGAMGESQPVFARYRQVVVRADPAALWELGRDARRFSSEQVPGEVLAAAADVVYLYNPQNCPDASLEWLSDQPMKTAVLPGATHWPSVDQPALLSETILSALEPL